MICQDCGGKDEYLVKTAGAKVNCTYCGSDKLLVPPQKIGAIISNGNSQTQPSSRTVIQDLPCGCRSIVHENEETKTVGKVSPLGLLVGIVAGKTGLENAVEATERAKREIVEALK